MIAGGEPISFSLSPLAQGQRTRATSLTQKFYLCAYGGVSCSILVFLALVSVTSLVLHGPDGYWEPAYVSVLKAHCEKKHLKHFARTFWNAWSNVAFVAAGGWALGRAAYGGPRGCPREWNAAHRTMISFWGLSACALGVGSFLHHASLTRWGQQVDVASKNWIATSSLAASLWHWLVFAYPGLFRTAMAVSPMIVAAVVADYYMWRYKWSMKSFVVGPGILGAVVLSETLLCARCHCAPSLRQKAKRVALSLICIGVLSFSLLLNELESRQKREGGGIFCSPDSNFQPHATGHVLSAVALTCLMEVQLGPTAFS